MTQINGVFGLAPILAATAVSVRRTLLVAVLATGFSFLLGPLGSPPGSRDWVVRAIFCAVISAVAVLSAANRVRRERQLVRMTVIAQAAQQAVLRALPTSVGPVELAGRYVSATADALVGGDLYEVTSTPHGVRMIVGDVRGKGLEAVQLAATVLGAFRQAAVEQPDLTAVVKAMDAVVSAVTGDEDFVTVALVQVGVDGRVDVVSCGHHPPLLLGPNGAVTLLDTGPETTPLGLDPEPAVMSMRWAPGTRLLAYTDGLVEARNPAGEFFSLLDHAGTLATGALQDALDALVAELHVHTGRRLRDDMALLLVEFP
ncbi:MAG: serine/threonine-protein phosphatase [Propionibacteriales bacterium]|nr:serine/threonine-protein phosphatase [Propionibacteriales bacterium]